MAMKLTDAQKATDNAIRSYNKQIEQAYQKLGYNHPVTRNLVATAKSVFGDNLSYKKITSTNYYKGQIDIVSGEILAIPQISRSKKNLDIYGAKQKIQTNNGIKNLSQVENLKRLTMYTNNVDKKQYYRHLYDVSKTYSNAVSKVRSQMVSNIPPEIQKRINEATTITRKNEILSEYLATANNDQVRTQLGIDIIATEIFDLYHSIRDGDDSENPLDIDDFRQFGYNYNNTPMANNEDALQNIKDALIHRQTILNQLETPPDEQFIGLLSDYGL